MKELLIRWAKAEPERCMSGAAPGPKGEIPEGDLFVLSGDHYWPVSTAFPHTLIRLQGAVQEAIEARGWTWRLNGPSQLNGKREWGPTATVFGDRLGTALGYYGELGDERSAAYSLLAAYLKAIGEAKRRARIDERWEAA